MSYGQKSDFQDGGRHHLELYIFQLLVTRLSLGSISAAMYQISSKSRFFTEIWRFNDFQNGSRLPSWIFKNGSICHVAFAGMPICFLVQISLKSDNRLMSYGQKTDFQHGGGLHLEFKKI